MALRKWRLLLRLGAGRDPLAWLSGDQRSDPGLDAPPEFAMIYQQLINGVMLGASYALVAVGYTLIFGVLNLLYFAHGEVFMVGAFVGLFLVLYAGTNIYFALLGAMIACAVLGALAFFVAVRPVPKDRPLAPLISTIGLTI